MNIPQDIKNPFSKRARAALNACAKFCNNLCMGFGIHFKQVNGGISIGIDQPKLVEWLREQKFTTACPSEVPADTSASDAASIRQAMAALAPEDVDQVPTDADGDPEAEEDSDKIARIGTSQYAARADHRHLDPVIHQTRQTLDDMFYIDPESEMLSIAPPVFDPGGRFIGLSDEDAYAIAVPLGNIEPGNAVGVLYAENGHVTTKAIGTGAGQVAAGDHNHNNVYAAKNHNHQGVYQPAGTVPYHTHSASEITGLGDGLLTEDDIGDSVQEHSSKLDALEAALNNSGKVPLSQLTGNISGHSGICYVTIDGNGNLGHSENEAYALLNAAKAGADQNTRLIRSIDLLNGLTYSNGKLGIEVDPNGGLVMGADGLKLPQKHTAALTLSGMLTCTSDGEGGHTLSFYPPTVDIFGRITGLSQNPAWSVSLLDNV
jgi:hypothetical protein